MQIEQPVPRPLNGRKSILTVILCVRLWAVLAFGIALSMSASAVHGQDPGSTASEAADPEAADETVQTMFPHFKEGRYWISGQANFIFQTNPPFYAKYSGINSFQPYYQKATSRVLTLYTGFEITKSIEFLVDIEEAGGQGLSQALGLAGFTNLDVVRNPSLGQAPYLARAMYHQVFALSHEKIENARGPLSTFSELPARRIEFRFGKFGMADFFDVNSVGGDSHLQFMNWAIDQNGGYANAENVEFELHRGFLRKKDGIIRLLSYVNNANMGIYQVANEQYLEGKVPTPDITNHPQQVTTKYGFGINFEQALTRNIVAYGRFGWNNGKTESWAYTEVDQTFQLGVGFAGRMWKRKFDRAGIAFVSNGISSEHARYLSYGGLGFILGDGGLTYGRENIFESYYTAHAWRGIYLGPSLQYIVNPGYNQVRGPVTVPSFRLHVEF